MRYVLYDEAKDGTLTLASGKNNFSTRKHAKKWAGSNTVIKKESKVAKKKRSAKQLANDKRLGRMAKARAKKKRAKKKTRRKIKRKRNVVRKGFPKKVSKRRTKVAKTHLQLIFRCRGNSVMWLTMDTKGKWNWTSDKGKAIRIKAIKQAAGIARGIARKPGYAKYHLGVVNTEAMASQIAAHCRAPGK